MPHTLTYSVEPDDVAAFNVFHAQHRSGNPMSPPGFQRGFLTIIILFVCLALAGRNTASMAIAFAVALVSYLAFPRFLAQYTRHQAEAQAGAPGGGGVICTHTLTISEDGVYESTPETSHSATWSMVPVIASTETHTFIYLGPAMAHVIPRHRVHSGDYEAFVGAARVYLARQRGAA